MKEKILEMRDNGSTYNEIIAALGCSKSTVAYYCGEGQKEKVLNRTRARRKSNTLEINVETKLYNFLRPRKLMKLKTARCDNRDVLAEKCRDFQRREGKDVLSKSKKIFTKEDVISKIGDNHKCYLTGRNIDFKLVYEYNFDHIIPASKGGSNELDNLGLVCREANNAKCDLLLEDFIKLCKDVLENNGYKVEKNGKEANSGLSHPSAKRNRI